MKVVVNVPLVEKELAWLWEMMEKMANGEARVDEIDTLLNLTKQN